MNNRTSAQIRQEFIDYFHKKCGHTFVPSSPCVPQDDPTLMFTNAGMNQFKPIFLGQQAPDVDKWSGATPGMPTRAANTQKCIRAGGKHNDLDDVGHDTYHHTFFEMLGNWSFGDYFKKEAIAWAWDLLTNVWGLDPERLHATYFQGDPAEGLEPDTEARDLWRAILPAERVHPGNKKDNFWEMGDTGPCGPCSEIHIDLTPDKSGGKLVNAGDARVMEIWNLVFIQYAANWKGDGESRIRTWDATNESERVGKFAEKSRNELLAKCRTLTLLPAKHVDTGMGFERITSVIQGMQQSKLGAVSNYDTDVFTPILDAIQRVTSAKPYGGLLEDIDSRAPKHEVMKDVAYRVIADHIRTLSFALTDGAVPSNEGRGFVLRRILRRAVRYGRQYLGTREPFLCNLVTAVAEAMGGPFPELTKAHNGKNVEHVAAILRDEEVSFGRTLDRGIALFNEAAEHARRMHSSGVTGEDAFKLHDTYGFPIDLTQLMAREQGLTVDTDEYKRLMEEARNKARAVTKCEAGLDLPATLVLPATNDMPKYEYPRQESAVVLGYAHGSKFLTNGIVPRGDRVALVLDHTNFYAEQGGQVGDTGLLECIEETSESDDAPVFVVEDSKRHGDSVLHIGQLLSGTLALQVGQRVSLEVDRERRPRIMKNHTATHVMNWALRAVLGDHVQQKGSLVDDEKTRFDLSHNAAISEQELAKIEALTNEQIGRDLPVYTENEVDQAQARHINTLRAVFGEKYPEKVRVVSVGAPIGEMLADPNNNKWMGYSVEFCGGTHVKRTGEIGRFRLVEESAVSKGVRRVVGVTDEHAVRVDNHATTLARLLKDAGHADAAALPQRIAEITAFINENELPVVEKLRMREDIANLQDKAKKAHKEAAKSGAVEVMSHVDDLLTGAIKAGSISIICGHLSGATADQLRAAADSLRAKAGSAAVLLVSDEGGKVTLLAAMTPDVVQKGVKAGDLIKEVAPVVGGKGGGRPDMAQGGGPDVARIGDAISAAASWLNSKLA